MSGLQILGAVMIVLFLLGMVASMATRIGWLDATKAFSFSVAVTAFVFIGVLLATGRIS